MKLSDYIYKRICIMQCKRSLKNLKSTSRKYIQEQIVRMETQLDDMHRANTKKRKS